MRVYKAPYRLNRKLLHKILLWAKKDEYFAYFNPNDHNTLYGAFDHFVAVGKADALITNEQSFEQLEAKLKTWGGYWVGGFSYDLKNEIAFHKEKKPATIHSPALEFFRPHTLIFFQNDGIEIHSEKDPEAVMLELQDMEIKPSKATRFAISCSTSEEEYLNTCRKIKNDIVEGEYYEMNYCIEFQAGNAEIDPIEKYFALNDLSPMPFSCLCKFGSRFVICASPERFLKRNGDKLISQPIKGTIRRGVDEKEDLQLKTLLRNSEKEIAENMMIVDLVRNDLSKSSVSGSVQVEEFFGIYTFKQVHQMISTITSTATRDIDNTEIIRNAFPMGSMTGAPKIRVMQAIEELENSHRGTYSGAIGYFKPGGDFDFNVVIRSIIYDEKNKKLSFHVGSAITYDAIPESEYEECLLKAKSMIQILSSE